MRAGRRVYRAPEFILGGLDHLLFRLLFPVGSGRLFVLPDLVRVIAAPFPLAAVVLIFVRFPVLFAIPVIVERVSFCHFSLLCI